MRFSSLHVLYAPRLPDLYFWYIRIFAVIGIGRLSAILRIIGIGRLVRWYRPIVVYATGKYKFLFFIIKSKQTREWLPLSIKVGAFCNFAFGCIFVLSALCSPSSK